METHISRMRWFGHVVQGGLLKCAKLIVVAQKGPSRSKNTWVEVLVDDGKKLGMFFADPQHRSEC